LKEKEKTHPRFLNPSITDADAQSAASAVQKLLPPSLILQAIGKLFFHAMRVHFNRLYSILVNFIGAISLWRRSNGQAYKMRFAGYDLFALG
jgi:hypothetical protein